MDFKRKRVLILEGYARQCLPYLRAFKKFGCETALLCNSKLDCGYLSRLPDHKILGTCDPDRYEESEKYIVDLIKKGNYDLVFPLVDFSAKILAYNKEELSKYARIASNNKHVFERSQDKLEVMSVCMENGISCPKTLMHVKSIDDVLNSGLKFPIIVKPRRGCGARGFHRFDERSEFEPFIQNNNIELSEMVIQECLPDNSLVMSDNIFVDNDGNIKSSLLYGSYRFYPIKGGTGTFNVTFNRSEIHEVCAKLVKLMNLRGCIGVDLIIDSRDNHAKVIEINPRALACSKIAFLAGVNQAQQVLEKEFGQDVTPMMEYKSDIRVRMMQIDFLWFLKSPNRLKAKPSWFSWKNTSDQTFAWDDPLPWFAFLINGMKTYKKEMNKRK